jgi:hypothetical protein
LADSLHLPTEGLILSLAELVHPGSSGVSKGAILGQGGLEGSLKVGIRATREGQHQETPAIRSFFPELSLGAELGPSLLVRGCFYSLQVQAKAEQQGFSQGASLLEFLELGKQGV